MSPDDLQKAPKLFCENIRIGFTPEYFVVGLSSGTQSSIYSLTPAHAKRFLQYLTHEITQFEKANGTIVAEWNPNIVSPVQKLNPPDTKS
ncbi:MAG: DUF3467 domain-containing protein [Candidatus Pacebacteria bacterium]|nr:DUF3467 domain-containing protein [Candidatus Paceibacterota bacterium]MCF7857048.1 DUF3467 domain-containing protein [Candidatus Paceibacterota bacterium]